MVNKHIKRINEIEKEIAKLEQEENRLKEELHKNFENIGFKEILTQNYDRYFLSQLETKTNFYPFLSDHSFSLYSRHKNLFDKNVIIEGVNVFILSNDIHCSHYALFIFSVDNITAFQGIHIILGKAFIKHNIIFYEKFDLDLDAAKEAFINKYFAENKLSYSFEFEAAKILKEKDKLKLLYHF